MPTAQDIVNYIEVILTQTSAMILAGLASGGGENDTYTITSNNQLINWINEGQNRISRLCVPIYDTVSVTPGVAGQSVLGQFTAMLSTSNRQLHTPVSVAIGTRNLTPANMGYINSNWYPATPAGEPAAWANTNTAIALSTYTTAPAFTVNGYFIPVPLTVLSSPIDAYLDDFVQRTIAQYVAWMVATKNMDNSVLASRIAPCYNEFASGVKELYARLVQADNTLSAYFPPAPIDSMLQVMKQVAPRN